MKGASAKGLPGKGALIKASLLKVARASAHGLSHPTDGVHEARQIYKKRVETNSRHPGAQ